MSEPVPAPAPGSATTPHPSDPPSRRAAIWHRHGRLLLGLAALALIGGAAVLWFWSGRERTDNAKIEGHVHPVAARVGGTVGAVMVRENDRVESSQVLLELDDRDYRVVLVQAEADLAAAEAAVRAARSGVPIESTSAFSLLHSSRSALERAEVGIELAQSNQGAAEERRQAAAAALRSAQAEKQRSRREVERLEPLLAKDQISRQAFDDASTALAASSAHEDAFAAQLRAAEKEVAMAAGHLDQARRDAERARSELESAQTAPLKKELSEARAAVAEAQAAQARARLERARLDLEYTRVRAPATGIVSRKRVEPGQVVAAGQPVLAIVDLDDVWVVANFKETQLRHLKSGQPATVAVDAYAGPALRGKVDSLGAATGARFSLLPAENATGNFVKVVQRVPVKIALDQPPDPERPLRPGMSVVVTVKTRGRAGD